jgi:dihydrofolate reductase
MSNLTIIVAASMNNVIGVKNDLPWKISADLKRFKTLTMGHPIIMGRKTHESIGKSLPGRENIILSRNKNYSSEGIKLFGELDEALKYVGEQSSFIIGGEEIYRQALPKVDKIELTRVHRVIPGDAFFPQMDMCDWKETKRSFEGEYSFISYVRK